LKYLVTILLLIFCHFSYAQKKWCITVFNTNDQHAKNISLNDSIKIKPYLKSFQYKYLEKGYPLAQFDSLVWSKNKDTLSAYFYEGDKFSSLVLNINNEDLRIIRKIPKISERILAKVPFKTDEIEDVYESILTYLENNGYPFARVRLNHLQLNADSPSAEIEITYGEATIWRDIYIKGDAKISPKFIKTYIGIREGDHYSEKLFDQIALKIQQLNFLAIEQQPQILFSPEGADLYLYLKDVPTSSANGILGLQPNDKGKMIFTGDVNLKLNNLLKHGESLSMSWKSLRPKTQQIEAQLKAPFLFKTAFGIEGNFHLYKRDSNFLELSALAGVQYFLGGGNYLRGFYRFESSHILSGATGSSVFSGGETVKTNYYGIGIIRNQVNYLPNPTRGLQLDIEASVGLRNAFPTDSSGNARKQKSTTSKIQSSINYFIPLGRRHTIRLGNITGAYYADTVYSNEQLRFGGLKAQRGFNEESLFATFFTTFSLEYRFLLDKNSNLFAFYDQSIYENNSGKYFKDTPFGFGLGISFGTKVGTFSLSYALGKQFSNAISLKDGKIHFGYIAFF